jgi:hypothetical protein
VWLTPGFNPRLWRGFVIGRTLHTVSLFASIDLPISDLFNHQYSDDKKRAHAHSVLFLFIACFPETFDLFSKSSLEQVVIPL